MGCRGRPGRRFAGTSVSYYRVARCPQGRMWSELCTDQCLSAPCRYRPRCDAGSHIAWLARRTSSAAAPAPCASKAGRHNGARRVGAPTTARPSAGRTQPAATRQRARRCVAPYLLPSHAAAPALCCCWQLPSILSDDGQTGHSPSTAHPLAYSAVPRHSM